jgi:hypothetical protein
MAVTGYRTVRKPQVGDLASHRFSNLDSREVARVSQETGQVWLMLAGAPAGPFSISNYTFKRKKES